MTGEGDIGAVVLKDGLPVKGVFGDTKSQGDLVIVSVGKDNMEELKGLGKSGVLMTGSLLDCCSIKLR
jgi:hypothetical protein